MTQTRGDRFTHGASGYRNYKCRCKVCTEGHRLYQIKLRARRREIVETLGVPSYVEHGASAYRNWYCRCGVCKFAHKERGNAEYWARKAKGEGHERMGQ
jgi:hypothetical protein